MNFSQNIFNFEQTSKKKNKIYLSEKKKILKAINNNSFGFITGIKKNNFSKINVTAKKLKNFSHTIFVGTGGSSLGGKTFVSLAEEILEKDFGSKISFIENIDTVTISKLLKRIDLKNTALVIISKSGETLETLGQLFFLINKMKEKKISLKNKVFVITEKKDSTLKKIQEAEGFYFLEHDQKIGGRFSAFSLVGLLPAKLAGMDIKKICDGAESFLNILNNNNNCDEFDDLFEAAYHMHQLTKKGKNISVFMPYIDSFKNLSLWIRQLWAESVGKKNCGTTLVNALGTVDQHSQLQLYLDGPKDKFFTIIGRAEKKSENLKMRCIYGGKNKFDPLHAKSLNTLLFAEMNSTIEIMKNKKLPLRVIQIREIHELVIGSLMMFFFLETIFSCYLKNVDPFNQPAVEEGKILTKKFLGNG